MIKLTAIWRLIRSENFILVTGGGSITASIPRNPERFNLMTRIVDKLSETDKPLGMGNGEGK